jgi:hypothetical protein
VSAWVFPDGLGMGYGWVGVGVVFVSLYAIIILQIDKYINRYINKHIYICIQVELVLFV